MCRLKVEVKTFFFRKKMSGRFEESGHKHEWWDVCRCYTASKSATSVRLRGELLYLRSGRSGCHSDNTHVSSGRSVPCYTSNELYNDLQMISAESCCPPRLWCEWVLTLCWRDRGEESIIYDPNVSGMFKKVNMLIFLTALDLWWKK